MSLATRPDLILPTADGSLVRFSPGPGPSLPHPDGRPVRSRVCLAAAHVVADPAAPGDPVAEPAVDWDATMAYRRHLWSYGLGVADAMDTAQRGGALTWSLARELIRRSAAEARAEGGGWPVEPARTSSIRALEPRSSGYATPTSSSAS